MKINYDYLTKIFNTFLDSDKAYLHNSHFHALILHDTENFVFHINILHDLNCISSYGESLGIQLIQGKYEFSPSHWRITEKGYNFAKSLEKTYILKTIKKEFSKESLSCVISISKDIVTSLAKKKLNTLLQNDQLAS